MCYSRTQKNSEVPFLALSLVTVEKNYAMHSNNARYTLSYIPYSICREFRCCKSRHQVQNEPPVSSVAGRNVAATIRVNIYLIY